LIVVTADQRFHILATELVDAHFVGVARSSPLESLQSSHNCSRPGS
jgi:hypothetical protein